MYRALVEPAWLVLYYLLLGMYGVDWKQSWKLSYSIIFVDLLVVCSFHPYLGWSSARGYGLKVSYDIRLIFWSLNIHTFPFFVFNIHIFSMFTKMFTFYVINAIHYTTFHCMLYHNAERTTLLTLFTFVILMMAKTKMKRNQRIKKQD